MQLWGPTNFAPIIRHVARFAAEAKKNPQVLVSCVHDNMYMYERELRGKTSKLYVAFINISPDLFSPDGKGHCIHYMVNNTQRKQIVT